MKTEPNERVNSVEGLSYGLTKREYFAAMAMQGLLAAHSDCEIYYAVQLSDALIAALNKATG